MNEREIAVALSARQAEQDKQRGLFVRTILWVAKAVDFALQVTVRVVVAAADSGLPTIIILAFLALWVFSPGTVEAHGEAVDWAMYGIAGCCIVSAVYHIGRRDGMLKSIATLTSVETRLAVIERLRRRQMPKSDG